MPPAPAPLRAQTSESLGALSAVEQAIAQVIRGKPEAIRLALTALLAGGHLLIEDIPGVGKTSLARALAAAVGGTFRRIQFTSDLLPSDIVGVSIFRQDQHAFEFRPGPLFANIILADEINRTTPRTQSALLEAMSEGQVSIGEQTHPLEQPFFVIATQNPTEHYGTYPLPESQLDRFLLRIGLGYPSRADEKQVLRERGSQDPIAALEPVIDHQALLELQQAATEVTVSEPLLDYAMTVIDKTRTTGELAAGVSTRGALGWYRAAQAHALVSGRTFCVPDDFKDLAVPALAHRVTMSSSAESADHGRAHVEAVIARLLTLVPIPT